jgi:hypothetical protein
MVKAALLSLIVPMALLSTARADDRLDIARLAQGWPKHFTLSGTKTEPTYVEQVRLTRSGDVFTLSGGAPAGMVQSREVVSVTPGGDIRPIVCPAAMRCVAPLQPGGFLASAAIVAAARRGKLHGRLAPLRLGSYQVVCIPAEEIGVAHAVLDPCVEIRSGAVLAQRHRLSGKFEGPSLDPWSIELTDVTLATH